MGPALNSYRESLQPAAIHGRLIAAPPPERQVTHWVAWLCLLCLSGCLRSNSKPPGEIYNAGCVFSAEQPTISHDFDVINSTSETVNVVDVERSCGCASFQLKAKRLVPGESTVLTVRVDVPKSYIQKSASCILKTDHPRLNNWIYTLQFTALPRIVADPAILDLGSFSPDDAAQSTPKNATVDVFLDSNVELPESIFTAPKELDLRVISRPSRHRIQGDVWNTRYKLSIGLKQAVPSIDATEPVVTFKTIELKNINLGPWSYSVYWKVLPALVASPSVLSFGNRLGP